MEVIIKFEDETQIQTDLVFFELTRSHRLKIAGATFGFLFIAALISIFIPVLHFFLVPAFLISAFVMFLVQYNKTSYIDLTGYNCPKCGEPLDQKRVFQSKKEPFAKVYCYHCRTSMKFMGSANA